MDSNFKELDDQLEYKDSVLYLENTNTLFKVDNLVQVFRKQFKNEGIRAVYNELNKKGGIPQSDWFDTGIEGELLKPNQDWQKGKVRIKVSLEFCLDEPGEEELSVSQQANSGNSESSLDDIRQGKT